MIHCRHKRTMNRSSFAPMVLSVAAFALVDVCDGGDECGVSRACRR